MISEELEDSEIDPTLRGVCTICSMLLIKLGRSRLVLSASEFEMHPRNVGLVVTNLPAGGVLLEVVNLTEYQGPKI